MSNSARRLIPKDGLPRWLPPVEWLRGYGPAVFASDAFAALLTALVSVPQGIAFALLAGLAPEQGLYAGVIPPLVYALFGTSRTLLVGPVSITAVMLASALTAHGPVEPGQYLQNALVLGFESGLILVLLSMLRLGSLVNFVSHPVLTGFTSGAALLIVLRLLPGLVGLPAWHCGMDGTWRACAGEFMDNINLATAALGLTAVAVMASWGFLTYGLLRWMGFGTASAQAVSKTAPLAVVVLAGVVVWRFDLAVYHDVAVVGNVSWQLPSAGFAFLYRDVWLTLLPSACYIGLVGYVSTVAMAKVTANMRRERIDPNQEALALGAANICAACFGSMPVAGAMSQTMLKIAAGAQTQMATLVTSALVAGGMFYVHGLFAVVPKAALAAIVLVAILPLIKLRSVLDTWRYQPADGLPEAATFLGVLIFGLEGGLVLGISLTLLTYLWQSSHPHIAVVGRMAGTEHYRNVYRHHVQTWPSLLLVRVDENLSFANAGFVEDFITAAVANDERVANVVLICASVSHIDVTALRMLESLTTALRTAGVTLHLAEVKGPVMDCLITTRFIQTIRPGRIFFRTDEAVAALAPAERAIVNLGARRETAR